ncbi:MAG: glutamyl-tRNA reductase [Gammaproteobacteria bacterium]|nr:glutamyl-tRNA reductase [Gammaproteobacteria bacterium]
MSLITLGINHKTAPVEIREQVAFTPERLPEALKQLQALPGVNEAAILSTCNRTEIYCSLDNSNNSADTDDINNKDQQIINWFSQFHNIPLATLSKHLYEHEHTDTIRHAFRVACGLDSMVLGEPQILGQMKQSYAEASQHGSLALLLGRLFQHAFTVAKQVRTDTAIGSSAVSVAFASVSLAKQIFGNLQPYTALMIGAGETIELAARHLHSSGIGHIIVANRTIERAQTLAKQFDAEAITLRDMPEHLERADIVISSTASSLPILGKGTVERALKKRKHKPIFMVDIAVPRDIEAEVDELDDVFLYTVDHLQEIITENLKSRQEAAEQAEEIIEAQVSEFLDWQKTLHAVDTIRDIREQSEALSEEVLEKTLKQIQQGQSAEDAVKFLARTLTNKFLHQPSAQLREAGKHGQKDVIAAARNLFLGKNKP